MSNEIASLEEISKFEKQQKRLLVQALDSKRVIKDHYFAQKVNMGDAVAKSKDQSFIFRRRKNFDGKSNAFHERKADAGQKK